MLSLLHLAKKITLYNVIVRGDSNHKVEDFRHAGNFLWHVIGKVPKEFSFQLFTSTYLRTYFITILKYTHQSPRDVPTVGIDSLTLASLRVFVSVFDNWVFVLLFIFPVESTLVAKIFGTTGRYVNHILHILEIFQAEICPRTTSYDCLSCLQLERRHELTSGVYWLLTVAIECRGVETNTNLTVLRNH